MKAENYVPRGVPVIRGTNLTGGRSFEGDWVFVSDDFADGLENCIVRKGDLVFPHRGAIGEVGIVPDGPEPRWMLSTSLMKVSCDRSRFEPLFYYYFFKSPQGRHELLKNASQVGTPGIARPLTSLKECVVPLPPLDEQRRIAAVLGALDDKIELNRKMNRTLEEMAQAIFKSWFIDFDGHDDLVDSEIGPVPRGWKVARAAEVAEVSIGKTPPRKEPWWFSTDPGDVRWMSIKDLGACGAYITETAEYLTHEAVERHRVKRIPDNTVVLSFKLTVGRVAITEGEMCSNEAIAHFRLPEGTALSPEYLYSYLKAFRYDDLGSTSSIATAVNSKVIQAMPVLVPERSAVARYDATVRPIFRKLKCLAHESRTLAELRDTLLPTLISGELRVPEPEALVEAAS